MKTKPFNLSEVKKDFSNVRTVSGNKVFLEVALVFGAETLFVYTKGQAYTVSPKNGKCHHNEDDRRDDLVLIDDSCEDEKKFEDYQKQFGAEDLPPPTREQISLLEELCFVEKERKSKTDNVSIPECIYCVQAVIRSLNMIDDKMNHDLHHIINLSEIVIEELEKYENSKVKK